MAKNRTKKNKRNRDSMDITEASISDRPQAMDTSESGASNLVSGATKMRVKKGRPMKRSKNARKMKSIAKAISKIEQATEKVLKHDSKKTITQSAKSLYE